MKIFILSILLLATVVFAADYGGADKYPIQTRTGGSYILSVSGVDISPTYDLQARADTAAVMLSLKCGCEVIVRQPVLKYSTEWRKVSSSASSVKSSSSSSAISSSSSDKTVSYIEWSAPEYREDNSVLLRSEISQYILHQQLTKDSPFSAFYINPKSTRIEVDESKGSIVQIAVQDIGGQISSYATLTIKKGLLI